MSGAIMKLALVLPLVLAALVGAARAGEADDIREASKAEAESFSARMYAGAPGNKAYACFVRRYDAEHLARHPKQKVAAMKLLVSAELDRRTRSCTTPSASASGTAIAPAISIPAATATTSCS